jgi:hypothetical protein
MARPKTNQKKKILLCVFLDLDHLTATELKDAQTAMEEKVYRIWTVLSAFEGKKPKSKFLV